MLQERTNKNVGSLFLYIQTKRKEKCSLKPKNTNRLLSIVLAGCMVATTLFPAIIPAAYAVEPAESPVIPGDAIMAEMPSTEGRYLLVKKILNIEE